VGTIHDQPEPVDFGNYLPAQWRKANIGAVTAAGNRIVAIIGEVNLSYAQISVERQHRYVIIEHDRALEIEANRKLAFNLGAPDIFDRPGEQEVVGVLRKPGTESGYDPDHLRYRIDVHPHVDRYVVHARAAVSLERTHVLVEPERKTGMSVPH
jgi:hypothetical protein